MKKLLTLLAVLIPLFANAQTTVPKLVPTGGVRPEDTAYVGRHCKIDSTLRLPKYTNGDSTKLLTVDSKGFLKFVHATGSAGGYTRAQVDSLIDTTFAQFSGDQAEAIALVNTLLEANPMDSVWFGMDSIIFRHLDGTKSSVYHPVTTQLALDDSAAAIRAKLNTTAITDIRRIAATDTVQYYKNGVWTLAFTGAGGGGGTQNLQSVLNEGSTAINNNGIVIDDGDNENVIDIKGTNNSGGAFLHITPTNMKYDLNFPPGYGVVGGSSQFNQLDLGSQYVELYSDLFNSGKTTLRRLAYNATNYTVYAPSATGTIVLNDNLATLTNKTLTSPALTGVPTAPTAANGTNTTQVATTAFVLANGGGGTTPSWDSTLAHGANASRNVTFTGNNLGGSVTIGRDSTGVADYDFNSDGIVDFHTASYITSVRVRQTGQLDAMNTVIKSDTVRSQYFKVIPSGGGGGFSYLTVPSTLGLVTQLQLPYDPSGFAIMATENTVGKEFNAILSGNGSTATFTVSHADLTTNGYTSSAAVIISPTSAAAAAPHYVTNKTSTSFDIVFLTAPASGTNNITFDYLLHY